MENLHSNSGWTIMRKEQNKTCIQKKKRITLSLNHLIKSLKVMSAKKSRNWFYLMTSLITR